MVCNVRSSDVKNKFGDHNKIQPTHFKLGGQRKILRRLKLFYD